MGRGPARGIPPTAYPAVAEAFDENLLDHDVAGTLVPEPVYPGGEGMDELSTEEFEEYNDTVYGYTPYVGYPAFMFTAKPRRKDHLYNESMGFEARFDTWCNFVSYSGSESHSPAGTYSSLVANSLSFDTYGGTSGSVKPIGVGSLTVYVITTTNEVEPITFSSVFHLPQPDVPPFILMGRNRLKELGWTATAGIKALERSSTRQLILCERVGLLLLSLRSTDLWNLLQQPSVTPLRLRCQLQRFISSLDILVMMI